MAAVVDGTMMAGPPPSVGLDKSRSGRTTEVVVIGAGPAGCLAAIAAANAGAQVTLLERADFPREKVCGCCIAPRGLSVLADMALSHVLDGAPRLGEVRLESERASVRIDRDSGVALSRGAFDTRLVGAAADRGVDILHGTLATVGADGVVRVHRAGTELTLHPAACVVADGLSGRSLDAHPGVSWRVSRTSRIGLGAILPPGSIRIGRGEVLMRVERGGYVGAVELEDGRIDVAAAIDHEVLRRETPCAAMMNRLGSAVRDVAAVESARWTGTPWLTRQRSTLAMPGILVAGDAAGYVEPFTGEGMSWALASGCAAGQLAARMIHEPSCWLQWPAHWEGLLRRDRWRCRLVAHLLRSPRTVHAGLTVARRWPTIAARLARTIGQPHHPDSPRFRAIT
ncbi:MAG: NAD(P)/FAD-dependent oxidoreductase [Phycisphaerae bacterium]|nr:NAD(P)/FAD-dependent oxidoreductase [Phycisphaerae bacterium]